MKETFQAGCLDGTQSGSPLSVAPGNSPMVSIDCVIGSVCITSIPGSRGWNRSKLNGRNIKLFTQSFFCIGLRDEFLFL